MPRVKIDICSKPFTMDELLTLLREWFEEKILEDKTVKIFLNGFVSNQTNVMSIIQNCIVQKYYIYLLDKTKLSPKLFSESSYFKKLLMICSAESGMILPIYKKPFIRKPVYYVLQVIVLHIIFEKSNTGIIFSKTKSNDEKFDDFQNLANLLLIYLGTFNNNVQNVLNIITRYLEGPNVKYITGSGSTFETKRRKDYLLFISNLTIRHRSPRRDIPMQIQNAANTLLFMASS